jgi:hypothetical protein
MFKVSSVSLQTYIDTPNCVLEDRVQHSAVHIPNIFCNGHLQIVSCWGTVRMYWVFLSHPFIRCTEAFDHSAPFLLRIIVVIGQMPSLLILQLSQIHWRYPSSPALLCSMRHRVSSHSVIGNRNCIYALYYHHRLIICKPARICLHGLHVFKIAVLDLSTFARHTFAPDDPDCALNRGMKRDGSHRCVHTGLIGNEISVRFTVKVASICNHTLLGTVNR